MFLQLLSKSMEENNRVNFRLLSEAISEKERAEKIGKLIDTLQELMLSEEERVSIGRANLRVDVDGYEGSVSLDVCEFRAIIGRGRVVFTVCGVSGSIVLEVVRKK